MTTEDYVAAELTAISPAPFAFQLLLPGSWEVKQVNEQPLTVDSPTIIAVFEPPQATNISVQVIGILAYAVVSVARFGNGLSRTWSVSAMYTYSSAIALSPPFRMKWETEYGRLSTPKPP